MKSRIIFFTVLLLLWIALCSWFYVCKVRSDCSIVNQNEIEPVATTVTTELATEVEPATEISPPPAHVIYFNSGSNRITLSEQDNDFISGLGKFLEQYPGYSVRITGYADNTGSESLNLKISSLRAEYIAQKLVGAGIATSLISSDGKGEADPVGDNNTPEGRSLNRRVNIITDKN
jgi:outer membrane protein OmpA-like peptidoglycan-associated protein